MKLYQRIYTRIGQYGAWRKQCQACKWIQETITPIHLEVCPRCGSYDMQRIVCRAIYKVKRPLFYPLAMEKETLVGFDIK